MGITKDSAANSHRVTWRLVGHVNGTFSEEQAAADMEAIDDLFTMQANALGCRVDRPNAIRPPVLVSYIAEKHGHAVGMYYIEMVGEGCFAGIDPEVTASARRVILPAVTALLRKRGVRWLRTFVPKTPYSGRGFKTLADRLSLPLRKAGMIDQDEALKHFAMDLRTRDEK